MAGTRKKTLLELLEGGRWTEGDARRVLAEAKRSGQSLGAFAAEHGLVAERLYRWARKLRSAPRALEAPGFAEIAVGSKAPEVEIELRSGHIVRVPAGIEAGALRRLLDAVEGDDEC